RPGLSSLLRARGLGDFRKAFGVQGGAAHQRAVDVRAGEQARGVVRLHASAIQDAGNLGQLGAGLLELRADRGVHLLRLLVGRDLAGANRPDWLVGDHAEAGLLVQLGHDRFELAEHDFERLARFALGQRFTDASDRLDAGGDRGSRLFADLSVRLAEILATLAVTDDHPRGTGLFEHRRADFTSEGTAVLRIEIL